MQRVNSELADYGSIYFTQIELTAGESDIYTLPYGKVYSIAAYQDGGTLAFSNDAPQKIIDGDSDVVWIDWDGVSLFNLGLTAFKFKHDTGNAIAKITVKTDWV